MSKEVNPQAKKKIEAIDSYDPYESVITDLNRAFHESYNHLIHKMHDRLGKKDTPVIVMSGDKVMLFHDDKQESVNIIPDLYHRIKGISHVSFGVYVTLANNGFGLLLDDNREDLVQKRDLMEKALSILDQEPIPPEYMEVQFQTLDNALAIVEEVLSTGIVDEERVLDFGDENVPLYLENAALGAALELDLLHETVMNWKEKMGPEAWDSVHVVVCAAHQARYRETTVQYFQRLFGEQEGHGADRENRVVYGEHIRELDTALDLLARHLVDQRASIELFGDRTRLQQDLMSDGAAAHLRELLPD